MREFTGLDVQVLEQPETKEESHGTKLSLTGDGTRPCSVSRGHMDGSSAGQREPWHFPGISLAWLSLPWPRCSALPRAGSLQ